MAVFRRDTSTGKTKEYHYRFMQSGKDYYGVCEGCTTERDALDYEKDRKADAKKLAEQKNVKALIENFRDQLAGTGEPITIAAAYDLYLTKPRKRTPGQKQESVNRAYMRDFTAFMVKEYPEIVTLRDVTQSHAEKYIHYLKTKGAFIKEITFKRQTPKKTIKESTYENKATKLSPRTINARHKLLKSIFDWLKADAGIMENPFNFETIANKTESRDVFSDKELQKIGDNLTMPYTKPVL